MEVHQQNNKIYIAGSFTMIYRSVRLLASSHVMPGLLTNWCSSRLTESLSGARLAGKTKTYQVMKAESYLQLIKSSC